MGAINRLAVFCLVMVSTFALAQDLAKTPAPQQAESPPVERWQKMSPKERAEMQRRFLELEKMPKARRDGLRKRAREIKLERKRLEKELELGTREKLRRMQPRDRDRILREHQKDQHRRAGQSLREGLDPDRIDWIDQLVGPGRPHPLQGLRGKLRNGVEDRLVERWQANGDLGPKQRERLKGLTTSERRDELLRIRRQRVIDAVEKMGLPAGVKLEQWQQALQEKRPERFLGKARELGIDRLGRKAHGSFKRPGGIKRPAQTLRELAEILRPTMADHLETAGVPKGQRRELVDERIAGRVTKRLLDQDWLPDLDRSPLQGLDARSLLATLHRYLESRRPARAKARKPGPRGKLDRASGRKGRGLTPGRTPENPR